MSEGTKNLSLSVEGMTCGGCARAVTKVIHKSDPDAQVNVDLDRGRVDVQTVADATILAAAITQAGYEAVPA
jgi:copper chaperone